MNGLKKRLLTGIAITVTLFLATITASTAMSGAVPLTSVANSVTPVGAFYYVWYGVNQTSKQWTGGWNTTHWTRADGITSEPAIGYYSSMNNATLKWQLEQMKQYNITFLVVSWWNDYTTQSLLNLYKYLSVAGGMKVAVLIEPYDGINVTWAMNYVWDNFYSVYPNETMGWMGKPLLCSFNPIHLQPDIRFTTRMVGQESDVDWNYWQSQFSYLKMYGGTYNMSQVSNYLNFPMIAKDGEVTVLAQYNDTARYLFGNVSSMMVFSNSWTNELAYAKANASIILLTSWNEWPENTALEPMRL